MRVHRKLLLNSLIDYLSVSTLRLGGTESLPLTLRDGILKAGVLFSSTEHVPNTTHMGLEYLPLTSGNQPIQCAYAPRDWNMYELEPPELQPLQSVPSTGKWVVG